MNQDILTGNWKQLRGMIQKHWGRLSDDELDRIGGERRMLAGKLQEKYGYARQKAEEEIDKFLEEVHVN